MLDVGALVSGRYRIDAVIGEGGMGAVYRAEHVLMHKPVALKVLHADLSGKEEIRERFEREAMAGAHIDHPNVACATDFGALADGSFFLVMEYIAGKSLRQLLDQGRLEPARALRIARGILAGLGAAHAKGVVHRDLKPENVVLVQKDGDPDFVKVLDFGIAKLDPNELSRPSGRPAAAAKAASPLTRAGAIIGTPEYMAPEQALGDPVDRRADLYALGVILYEMLAGSRPFGGGALTLMRAHALAETPALPPDLDASVGPRVAPILKRAMAKLPVDRYQSAAELDAALVDAYGLGSLPSLPSAPASTSTMRRIAVATPAVGPAPSPTSPTVLADGSLLPIARRPRWMKLKIVVPAVLAVLTAALAFSLHSGAPAKDAAAAVSRREAVAAPSASHAADRPKKQLVGKEKDREKPRRRGFYLPFF
jgi:serine/threonine-protein kinase